MSPIQPLAARPHFGGNFFFEKNKQFELPASLFSHEERARQSYDRYESETDEEPQATIGDQAVGVARMMAAHDRRKRIEPPFAFIQQDFGKTLLIRVFRKTDEDRFESQLLAEGIREFDRVDDPPEEPLDSSPDDPLSPPAQCVPFCRMG